MAFKAYHTDTTHKLATACSAAHLQELAANWHEIAIDEYDTLAERCLSQSRRMWRAAQARARMGMRESDYDHG